MSRAAVTEGTLFLRFATGKIEQLSGRVLEVSAGLPDEVFWGQPNEATNSVAQLLLHLAGNLRQWVLHGMRGDEDRRARDAEFAAQAGGTWTRGEVIAEFRSTVTEVLHFLRSLEEAELLRRIRPQGYEVSVLEAAFHVTEHFSYHAGQVFLLVKLHLNTDLGFYRHLANSNKTHDETQP